MSFNDALKRDQLSREIEGRGVEHLYATYSAAVAADDSALALELELASEPWLRRMLTEDRSKAAARRARETGRVDADESPYEKAGGLIRAFENRREEAIPREVRMAEQVYSRLLIPAYINIIGTSAWDLSPAQMTAIYSGVGGIPDDLQIFRGWHLRTLPKSV